MAIKNMTIEELEARLPDSSQVDKFCGHFSDTYLIRKVNTEEVYGEAIDIKPCTFEYVETEILKPINNEEPI